MQKSNPMKAEPNVIPQFDVFLSHSSVDKPWVIRLKGDLLRYGVSVWLDKDEIRPGNLFGKALEQALDNCLAVALIVSPEATTSGWVEEEYYRALSLAKNKPAFVQIIPVVLREAELPGFLKNRNWVDFRDETTYAQSVWTLVWGITGEKPAQILDLSAPDLPYTAPVQSETQTEALTAITTTFSDLSGKSQGVVLFQDGGALLADSPVYIERHADRQAQNHLLQMEYITIVEPRQQGKTSLINRLTGQFQSQSYLFPYVDFTTLDKTNETAWYASLSDWLLRQIKIIPKANRPPLPANGNSWRDFLADLAELIEAASLNLVIALDEVGNVPEAWATDFFSVIRSVYNSRQSMPCFRHLTFIVAGAYNPKELIKDPHISNFNVDHRISLTDFNLSQVEQLAVLLPPDTEASEVAAYVHYWTNGQPFLCQRLGRILAEQGKPVTVQAVDEAVHHFIQEDTNHLSRIQKHLADEPELLDYARLTITEKSKFSPGVNDWQFKLAHIIGLISADEEGRCRIRNRIYAEAFPQLRQPSPAQPTRSTTQPSLQPIEPESPVLQPPTTPLKLQLTQRGSRKFEVRVIEGPTDSDPISSRLPYTPDELTIILKALHMPKYEAGRFTPAQRDTLKRLKLLDENHFIPELSVHIGEMLYKALMVGEVGQAFQTALIQIRPNKGTVALQLRFDKNATELARYPWELLYHNEELLLSGAVELTRYISYDQAVTPWEVSLPLRLLYIQSRPTSLSWLADNESAAARQALAKLEADGLLQVEVLPQPTYQALLDHLETRPPHILHFDGHGVFARRCPECQAMNYPHHSHCQAESGCSQRLTNRRSCGYLAFEAEGTRRVHWLHSRTIGNLLYKRSVRLAVLSACRSGSVGGEMLLSSTAPALIQAGVPAVVSTQLPIGVDEASQFVDGFYRALARFESIPAAVNAGRQRISPDTGEWFIPTLYLRSKDEAGSLFRAKR